jgi:hypothetical protein
MNEFLGEATIERRGYATGVESLRRLYTRTRGPITPAEFRRQLLEAGCQIADVAGGGQLVLHRRKRGAP